MMTTPHGGRIVQVLQIWRRKTIWPLGDPSGVRLFLAMSNCPCFVWFNNIAPCWGRNISCANFEVFPWVVEIRSYWAGAATTNTKVALLSFFSFCSQPELAAAKSTSLSQFSSLNPTTHWIFACSNLHQKLPRDKTVLINIGELKFTFHI